MLALTVIVKYFPTFLPKQVEKLENFNGTFAFKDKL
jgi:hypothetical protein